MEVFGPRSPSALGWNPGSYPTLSLNGFRSGPGERRKVSGCLPDGKRMGSNSKYTRFAQTTPPRGSFPKTKNWISSRPPWCWVLNSCRKSLSGKPGLLFCYPPARYVLVYTVSRSHLRTMSRYSTLSHHFPGFAVQSVALSASQKGSFVWMVLALERGNLGPSASARCSRRYPTVPLHVMEWDCGSKQRACGVQSRAWMVIVRFRNLPSKTTRSGQNPLRSSGSFGIADGVRARGENVLCIHFLFVSVRETCFGKTTMTKGTPGF
ncbi:hypothetical protein B0T22DRAFT_172902 [Podospora appendiculata]|uniref:Uncharacterized protein n=1 Tax=Podospora appendiculata TaxID=314037 RepID=A0AAE1CDG9_9PEZI|nr:hypothetical protein B0T22DRAFT_172902 [Podospora appendiculata]